MEELYNLFLHFENHVNIIFLDLLEGENYFDLVFLHEEKDKF